ncbi:radical SAM family heme chaperone HemW [Anaerobacillus sp. MEB173]|uniref:radical SAM family heme chaperone HemW n=1 Tax=Anaerobacillus sp. MEB173 TaxID=3383345 RepID=UPI003F93ECE4
MTKAVYVHVPFCEQICHYCDFNKVFLKGQPLEQYLSAFQREVEMTVAAQPPISITSIYIGGGTPTALDSDQLSRLLKVVNQNFLIKGEHIEYTVEVNPGTVDEEKLTVLKEAGVNRLSIGVQAFQDELLQTIGRIHRASDVYKTIELARKAGFNNLSLDLMFGLPGQTEEMFKETLQTAFSLSVEHFSAYSLKVEEKTVFYHLQRKGKLSLPPEDEEVKMYELLIEEMDKYGYAQYEISNFAKKGFESQHNLTYWNNDEYYGLGAGAHGYVDGVRHVNAGPVTHYIKHIEDGNFPYIDIHEVTKSEKMEEEMFMGLRKLSGICKTDFHRRFGLSLESVFGTQVKKLQEQGLLCDKGDRVFLTKKGIMLGNEVFEKFIGLSLE